MGRAGFIFFSSVFTGEIWQVCGWHGSALLKAAVPLRKCNKNRGGVNYAQAVNGFCSREVDDMDVRQTD